MRQLEVELRQTLEELHADYERVNRAVRAAQDKRRFLTSPREVQAAEAEEADLLREMNRIMDRLRAVESHLKRLKRGEGPRFV